MEAELICNFKKCRKPLTSLAWVTSCSHIFCNDDGLREFSKTFVCPACNTQLPGKLDIIRVDLNPSEQYKSMVIVGQKPDVILEIASRALSFWAYQMQQETMYQKFLASKSHERCTVMEQYYEDLLQKDRNEVNTMKLQIDSTKKEQDNIRKKYHELYEKLVEKKRQYQKLFAMYESLKRKCMSNSVVYDGNANISHSMAKRDLNFASVSGEGEFIRPFEVANTSRECDRRGQTPNDRFLFRPQGEGDTTDSDSHIVPRYNTHRGGHSKYTPKDRQ